MPAARWRLKLLAGAHRPDHDDNMCVKGVEKTMSQWTLEHPTNKLLSNALYKRVVSDSSASIRQAQAQYAHYKRKQGSSRPLLPAELEPDHQKPTDAFHDRTKSFLCFETAASIKPENMRNTRYGGRHTLPNTELNQLACSWPRVSSPCAVLDKGFPPELPRTAGEGWGVLS